MSLQIDLELPFASVRGKKSGSGSGSSQSSLSCDAVAVQAGGMRFAFSRLAVVWLGIAMTLPTLSPAAHPSPAELPSPVSLTTWRGFSQLNFEVAGRPCLLVLPEQAVPGRPWIWRTEFFGHAPQADLALLARGWHVAYMQASDLYGAPPAMALFDAFYQHLVKFHQLAPRAVMEGLSRGGLYAFNFAVMYPDRVSALYLDAPVLNLQSWPGRSKHTPEGGKLWRECMAAYGLDDAGMAAFKGSPIDRIEPLARARIPILSVCGDADFNVPLGENTAILAERYRALGGLIEVIIKPGGKHHPHSLEDPTPIVDFLIKHARPSS